ncbi:MAG: hypothetical protein JWP40_739 [Blastococcus sp.]|nr:hypothetical protein [Blastococcus sp.]
MTQDGAAPNPLSRQDAAALIGVAAVLEGALLTGEMDPHLVGSLNRHLHKAGLVGPGAGAPELRLALADLNQRIRYVLGEYADPPVPGTGEADQFFGFASRAAASSFAAAAGSLGEAAAPPVAVDGRAYDGDVNGGVHGGWAAPTG